MTMCAALMGACASGPGDAPNSSRSEPDQCTWQSDLRAEAGRAAQPSADAAPRREPGRAPTFSRLFPGVWADLTAKIVEFDADVSPMLVNDPKAPLFFVETLVCAPDTREHESLLVTSATPSHLHAALLAIGLSPGVPGLFRFESGAFAPVDAMGDRVRIHVLPKTDSAREVDPAAGSPAAADQFDPDPRNWLIHVVDRGKPSPRRFGTDDVDAGRGWVFAGSSVRTVADQAGRTTQVYDADGTGIVIGLCCFGSEVIAWSRTFSPDASVSEPDWIADFSRTPPPGTKVRVRVQKE